MPNANPVTDARDLIDEQFPDAAAAIVTGSVLTSARTAHSDIDLLVVFPTLSGPWRATIRYRTWPVELFANTVDGHLAFIDLEVPTGRSCLLRMFATGTVIVDRDGSGSRLVDLATSRFAAGPPPWSATEIDRARYDISDLVDDLTVAPAAEIPYIANALVGRLAEAILRSRHRWSATGKWIARELAAADPTLLADLTGAITAVAHGDTGPLVAVADHVLEPLGGPLLDGFSQGPAPLSRAGPAS